MSLFNDIEQDIWAWIEDFVATSNEFYDYKFPPCPYARGAMLASTVDVVVYEKGNLRKFIRDQAIAMRDNPKLTTRVMAFPPRAQFAWGIGEYVETLNTELIKDNLFMNTGVTKTKPSRYANSTDQQPYFIVVANSLDAVLKGAKSLQKTQYYKDWPEPHYKIVVERRENLAKRYGKK